MAAVELLSSWEVTTNAWSSASWDQSAGAISGASFTASDDYLIIAQAGLKGNNTGQNAFYIRVDLPDGTAVNLARVEPSGGVYWPYQYMGIVTATGSDALGISIYEGGSYQTTSKNHRLFAMNLSELTENSDYWYNENTTDTQNTATPTARASVTFTPPSGADLLVLGWAKHTIDGTTTAAMMEVAKDGTRFGTDASGREGEDTVEYISLMAMGVDEAAAAASSVYSVQTYDSSGGVHNHNTSHIFVLRLDVFETHAIDGPNDNVGTTALQEVATLGTYTPATTGDQALLGFWTIDEPGLGPDEGIIQLAGVTGDRTTGEEWGYVYDAALDRMPFILADYAEIADTGVDVDMDVDAAGGTPRWINNATLVVFSAELDPGAGEFSGWGIPIS